MDIVTITTQVTPTFDSDRTTVSEQYAYRITIDHLIMVLPVHGVLQRSILLLPVQLLIHLHQLMLVLQPHNAYCNYYYTGDTDI